MNIKPEYYPLDDLLKKNLFRVPQYQRAYSWEGTQRDDLFNDIKKLRFQPPERHHFMSTVVCLETGAKEEAGTDEYDVLDIVDGQQRLTTIIIILKALAIKLAKGSPEEKKEAKRITEILVKDNNRLILLQTNHDSSRMFRKFLTHAVIPPGKSITTAAEKNLIEAFNECNRFVEEWPESPLTLLKLIKNRLGFIFYVLQDEGAVYRIFEVLNSRGLEVDWLDKCKSMLMGIAFDKYDRESRTEQISELHKIWTKIYEAIGIQQVPGHEIIRMAATFRHSDIKNRILSAEIATEFLRDLCVQDPHLVFDISEEILDIARKLKELYSNVRLKAVTDILHARFLAIAIMLSTKLDQRDKEALLKKWEKITFLIFGLCRNDSRMKVGDYTNLAQQVVNGLSAKQISTSIDSLIDSQEVKSGFEKLKGSNWYERPDDLLYFLYRYEEYLTDQAGVRINREIWTQIWQESTNKTIEHIYPQADNPGPSWRGKLGKGQKPEKQINRLGNLIILPPGVNSEAGKRPFIDKKKIYSKHRNLRLIEEILRKRDWNKNSIDQRESKLLKWAKATWAQ